MKRVSIERILCPVDFSEFSVKAYIYALSVAQHYGAKLIAQHVVELWRHRSACFAAEANQYKQFCERLVSAEREELRLFVQKHTPTGKQPECVTQVGMASDCILAFAQQESANLIVLGTHGAHGFERLTLGSVTEAVLRKAHCPVLAVHGPLTAQAAEQQPLDLREVVFCTDFSEDSNRACDYALSLATEYKANLTLVHVLEGAMRLRSEDRTAKAYQGLVKSVPEQSMQGGGISTTVRTGKPYKEISQLASEKHADLVIMAVHDRNALNNTVFGSPTYRVVEFGHCPVLAVPA